jgi:protein-disulfide isomerase
MASGKQSKRRRAAPPPVHGQGARRQASPRVLLAALAVAVVAAVGITLGIVLSGGSKQKAVPARGSLTNALPGAADVQRLLLGIPQNGTVLGSPSAPVTLVEYIDLQCPICREFETQAMPTLIPRYVRTGKVKVEARPIAFIGPDSERGRAAALAAAGQNRLFDYTQLLYVNQGPENSGWLKDQLVGAAAASIPGLDVRRLLTDRNSAAVKAQERAIDQQASSAAVRGTPTIDVGRTGSTLHRVVLPAPTDPQPVVAAIEAALRP